MSSHVIFTCMFLDDIILAPEVTGCLCLKFPRNQKQYGTITGKVHCCFPRLIALTLLPVFDSIGLDYRYIVTNINCDAHSSSANTMDIQSNRIQEIYLSDDDNVDSPVTTFQNQNENAFSSDSDDEEEDDDEVFEANYPVSEFDKALRTGVPNRGAASFEDGEFYREAEDSLVKEVLTADESLDTPPRSTRTYAQKSSSFPLPPPATLRLSLSNSSTINTNTTRSTTLSLAPPRQLRPIALADMDLAAGVLPDVLMTMRQKIESITLFDSDMMRLAEGSDQWDDRFLQETRESLKRSSQQSLSAAVLVSLAHKRYERRRLAAMEIEKVVRSLVQQGELDRVRAILLLLSDDYVRSTSEDARKGGVVALAACAIGLKKASDAIPEAAECRDLILASVVHACQDHSQRVRYYATESLFNVVKVIPTLAVQHFFILFEILRSLFADVDVDVRSGAELLDKKLKEVIVGAINSGQFTADACVPIFARFVCMRNKATKRLTLTWLQELNEKLFGAPVLDFLHLFLGGIFAMIADPNISIRQSALAFLQSVLPKLLIENNDGLFEEDAPMKVDFDKLIQSLVTTLEHPDPFVRKVAMYWMSRIVRAHMGDPSKGSPASMSVRNSLPHVLPGILLSIGDTFHNRSSTKDSFLPDQTTRSLAEQTNECLQNAVRRDGKAYVSHLDGFIVALREELDSPSNARNPPAIERKPYRMDVTPDGTGIESTGWFRSSRDTSGKEDPTMMSRLCALQWVTVLYESVVPDVLKADYAREFIAPIIHQLVDNPPETIIFKSLEVLAKITVPVESERLHSLSALSLTALGTAGEEEIPDESNQGIMANANVVFALDILETTRGARKSRDREVFSALIQLHAYNHQLLADLSRVIQFMCTLQPPEFVFVSFAVELDRFIQKRFHGGKSPNPESGIIKEPTIEATRLSAGQDLLVDLEFVSSFVQQMNHVLLNTDEAEEIRDLLQDCIGSQEEGERGNRRERLFHILLHSFSHNLIASVSLCLWAGAFKTACSFLYCIDPLDINLSFFMELDKLVEVLERPLFRHLHLRMLECDAYPKIEGSGAMLFRTLKSLLMMVPQSTCYKILRDRLVSVSRFRQTALVVENGPNGATDAPKEDTQTFSKRVLEVRALHCKARWEAIRTDSLETAERDKRIVVVDEGADRRKWLGYANKEEEATAKERHRDSKRRFKIVGFSIEEVRDDYHESNEIGTPAPVKNLAARDGEATSVLPLEGVQGKENKVDQDWKSYWAQTSEEDAQV